MQIVEKNYPFVQQEPIPSMIPPNTPYEAIRQGFLEQLPQMRKMMGGNSRDITKRKIVIEDKIIAGYKEDIRIRIYTPEEKSNPRAFMLFCHGGGWFGGTIEATDEYCKSVADSANAVVVSVDYHLAPEYPYPCGLKDCYSALKYAWNNSEILGIDKNIFSVSGDSAGGNLSAALSLMTRGTNIKITHQILLYPAVILTKDGVTSPSTLNDESAHMAGKIIGELYIGENGDPNDPLISPLLAEDLTNLPKTMVVVCEFDGLLEQGIDFAKKLSENNNYVECYLYKNTNHAFIDNTGNLKQVENLIVDVVNFFLK